MKFPWKIVKVTEGPADEKLEHIKNLLFPPLELREELAKDGTTMKFHVDYSVDSNLDAVLLDLQDGNNDTVVQKTLNNIIGRLNHVRRALDAYAEFDKDATYIIVDDGSDKKDIEAANFNA
jgi:hypothetical protein